MSWRSIPASRTTTPEVIAVHSDRGLTAATQQFHRHLRARSTHPATRPAGAVEHVGGGLLRPRPRHAAARSPTAPPGVGVERFVLDDGWFGSRRDDRSGLGDWVVSADAHPKASVR